jgi:citrate lyase subunit beta/citryl-CoA lyase
MENVGIIAGSSARNRALIFGPGDLAASLGLPELTIGSGAKLTQVSDYQDWFLSRVIVAARANGLLAIDGPYALVRDADGLRLSAERSARLGFDGKWAVHPDQIDLVNEVFTPQQKDFDKASAMLEALRVSTEGSTMFGDEMIDEASRKMALLTVERGRLAGMKEQPWPGLQHQPTQPPDR